MAAQIRMRLAGEGRRSTSYEYEGPSTSVPWGGHERLTTWEGGGQGHALAACRQTRRRGGMGTGRLRYRK